MSRRTATPVAAPPSDRSPDHQTPVDTSGRTARLLGIAPLALAVLAVLVRLPFLTAPLTSDEGGFLMVGSQWSPGASLYGSYWVDRPPGLIAIFAVVHALGGQVALRLVGAGAAALAVLAAGALGRHLAPSRRTAPALCALLVLALVSSPLLDMAEVDGEILALPLVLGGLVMLARAVEGGVGPRVHGVRVGWGVGAGAAGLAAASIKQNVADVAVAAVVLALALLLRRRWRDALALIGSVGCGAVVVAAALLGLAVSRGTSLPGLWQAVVVFRVDASAVLAQYASAVVDARGRTLLVAFVATGAPVLLLALGGLRWRASPWPWVLAAVLTWEGFGVVAGGSYWLHYLVGLVPGLVLLLAASLHPPGTHDHGPRRVATRVGAGPGLALVVLSGAVGLCFLAAHPPTRPADQQAVAEYLAAHREAGTSAVTAFGDPALLQQAGMHSPSPDLWSLPVRVHDPSLTAFSDLLRSPQRPQWVVMTGRSLRSWGLDARTADRVLERRYTPAFRSGGLRVLARRD